MPRARIAYDEKAIQTLDALAHIRLRSGMYIGRIGDGSHPLDGIYVMLKEVVDNAVDEFIMDCGKRVDVTRDGDEICVRDFGRGIPLGKLVECVSQINTGGKYNDDVFQFSVGLNGVGTKAVNALSAEFEVTSWRDGKFRTAAFQRGQLVSDERGADATSESGTLVRFRPDREIFKTFQWNDEFIAHRLHYYAYLNAGLTLLWNGERFHSRGGLADLLQREIGSDPPLYEPIHCRHERLEFALTHGNSYGETYYSFVNGQYTNDGGTHQSAFREGLLKGVNEFAKQNFAGEDVRDGIVGAVAVKLTDPVFDSQTKNKLGSTDVRAWVVPIVKEEMVLWLHRNPEAAERLLAKIRTNEKVRKELASVRKEARERARKVAIRIPKLTDCKFHLDDVKAKRRSETSLFITEGDSAGGVMVQCRDVYTQAIFALKGKPLNCHGLKRDAIYRNEELYNLMRAMGLEEGAPGLRYNKIVIATDADVDGMHIRNLLLTYFLRYFEDIAVKGHLYILETPLYRVRNKRETRYCYSDEERAAAESAIRGAEVTRFKGLGEISPGEFGRFIGEDARLLPVSVQSLSAVSHSLDFFMGKNTPERRDFIVENLSTSVVQGGPLMAQLDDLMRQNFIDYASYSILDRAIPDARDGLKPVQRRILHTLQTMDDGRFHKVANVIGETMKLHPHGDASIGSALVVLANKDYFIERQGNFGSPITGHPAAAPRYIECRLTELARESLFNPDLTEWSDSYDGRSREPVWLPVKLPVVLMLGAEGIAVGMTTRVLSHNPVELWRAQIAWLQGQEIQLYPDFPQGGCMDASEYDDGQGKVEVRARIETTGTKAVVIREIPHSTTTESVIASIETAVQKGRVKVSSINDYTTDRVEIELKLPRGVSADEVVPQLYAYTECSVTVSSNVLVIRNDKPVVLRVSEVLAEDTERLREQLRRELEWNRQRLLDRQHWLTLEQIFVEERVYKRIEKAATEKKVRSEVVAGMKPHSERFVRPMLDEDVKRLLELRIRRISAWDIEKNRGEIDAIAAELDEVTARLADLTETTIAYLEGLIARFGDRYPRRTELTHLEVIEKKSLARQEIKLGYDADTGFLGTAVKTPTRELLVSEYDLVLGISDDGSYRIMTPGEKVLLTGKLLHLEIFDPEKGAEFTVVYRDRSRNAFGKRVHIHKFIRNREYELIKGKAGRIDLLLPGNPGGQVSLAFAATPRQRIATGKFDLGTLAVMGTGARGVRLARKPVKRVQLLAAKSRPRGGKRPAPRPRPRQAQLL